MRKISIISLFLYLTWVGQMPALGQAIGSSDTITVLIDSLKHKSFGMVTGGDFLPDGGWKVSSTNAMIFYDLNTYISSGSLEITVTNFNPKLQNTFRRHHVLSMYTNHWGEHHQIELLDTDWNFHTGFNYYDGVKLQSATYEDDRRVVIPWDSLKWDLNQTYRLKFVWEMDSLFFFRDDSLISTTIHTHNFLLRYIYLGRDRTISGDYITNFDYQQYPAMVGPIFSELIVKKFLLETAIDMPQLKFLSVSQIYANAARLRWQFSEPVISKLIYRRVNTANWDSTRFFELPRKEFEYVITGLLSGQKYETRVIFKNERGNRTVSEPVYFKTRNTEYFLFKPSQDTFVEDAGIIGPYRNIANMGWLYLMVGKKRISFLRFPALSSQERPRKTWLKAHIRNKWGDVSQLKLKPIKTEWDENTVTWNTQPEIGDTSFSEANTDQLYKDDWVSFLLPSEYSLSTGPNFAITTSDSGWISLDSKESYDAQPELIIDYRRSYVLEGEVYFSQKVPLNNVSVTIQSFREGVPMYPPDTLVTDTNGYFEKSLALGESYEINLAKEPQKTDLKSITIYDAYMTAATAVGIINPSEMVQMAADANGDGRITIYDALLIAKVAIGLDTGGVVGNWRFSKLSPLTNEEDDSVFVSASGVVVGDVDCSWPNKVIAAASQNNEMQNFVQTTETDSNIIISFPRFETRRLGSFSIDFSYDPHSFDFVRVYWPHLMRSWTFVQNVQDGHVRLGSFSSGKSRINLKNLKMVFLKKSNKESFKMVIHKIQLDNWIGCDILTNGVEEQNTERKRDSFSVYPNPFNRNTRIEADVPASHQATLLIYDVLGQLIFSKNMVSDTGHFTYIWNGNNNQNSFVSSGIYYIKLNTEKRSFEEKILFLK